MFCPECGKEIKDGAKFCPYCGNQIAPAVINESAKGASGTSAVNSAAEKVKSVSRNTWIGIGATVLAVAVVAAIVLAIIGMNGKGYERQLDQMVKYLNSQYSDSEENLYKLNGYTQFALDDYWEEYQLAKNYLGRDLEYLDSYLDAYDALSDQFGADYKISYEIINKQEISARELRDWETSMQDSLTDSSSFSRDLRIDYDNDLEEMLDYWIENENASEDTTTSQLQEYITQYDAIDQRVADTYGNSKCTEGYKLRVRFSIEGSLDSATETREVYVYYFGDTWNVYYDMRDIANVFIEY